MELGVMKAPKQALRPKYAKMVFLSSVSTLGCNVRQGLHSSLAAEV